MTDKTDERNITMAVTGYVFAVTTEHIKDRTHGYGIHTFKDTQEQGIAAAKEYADFFIADSYATKPTKTNAVYQIEGTGAIQDGKIIVRVQIMSVAEALNLLLAKAQRKHTD
jgi:hypothetical protein